MPVNCDSAELQKSTNMSFFAAVSTSCFISTSVLGNWSYIASTFG